MIGRTLALLMCGAAGWAQLPPAQAPPPFEDSSERPKRSADHGRHETAQLDAVVYGAQGQPVTGLQAGDFSLTVDGKSQKIEKCEYRTGEPLRLAVILDDLSLSAEHSYSVRRELRRFVEQLGPADEVAILRASAGSGAADRLTSDKRALNAALDSASYNPAAENASSEALAGTFRVAVRGALEGLRRVPGRKSVLVISDRLRDPARNTQLTSIRLAPTANLASTALYIVDMTGGQTSLTQLDLGLSETVRDTGGRYFDGDQVAAALAQIARDQAGYYLFTYRTEGSWYDYLAAKLRVQSVQLTTARPGTTVRARNGLFGAEEDDTAGEIDINPGRAIGTELIAVDVSARVTALAAHNASWTIEGAIHIDGKDVTLIRGLDGKYRGQVDVVAALEGDNRDAAERASRTIGLTLTDKGLPDLRAHGLDYTTNAPVAKPGTYQLLIVVRDGMSGKTGTARSSVTADWGPAKLAMTSLILRGNIVKGPDGVERLEDGEESASVRRFRAGRKVTYSYELVNLAADAEKRSRIDVTTRVWRDGALILDGDPSPVEFEPSQTPVQRGATGSVQLKPETRPGRYIVGVTVRDKISGRTATRFMDFEVTS